MERPYMFVFSVSDHQWGEIHEIDLVMPNKPVVVLSDFGRGICWPDDISAFVSRHTGGINSAELVAMVRCHYRSADDAKLSPSLAVPDVENWKELL